MARISVYIIWPSVLGLANLKLHKPFYYIQEKSITRLTFNPGLASVNQLPNNLALIIASKPGLMIPISS